MHTVIYHQDGSPGAQGARFFQSMLSIEPLARMIRCDAHADLLAYLATDRSLGRGPSPSSNEVIFMMPRDWEGAGNYRDRTVIEYTDSLPLSRVYERPAGIRPWNLLLNGNYATRFDTRALDQIFACFQPEDVMAVTIQRELRGFRENAILTDSEHIAGFRRYFEDAWAPAPTPTQWPHLLFLNARAAHTLIEMGDLPLSFTELVNVLTTRGLTTRAVALAGDVCHLCHKAEFLAFYQAQARMNLTWGQPVHDSGSDRRELGGGSAASTCTPRLLGNVCLGKNARIDPSAVVLGPSIIADDACVEKDAIVDASIIGPGVTVGAHQLVRDCIMTGADSLEQNSATEERQAESSYHWADRYDVSGQSCFRLWPVLSYPRVVKRAADILASLAAIALFLPLVPVIAIAVKLSSPGPVFYRARRQGRYGKDFDCLKFRTMRAGADQIQEKLRTVSEVDGPQFKIADDPRITAVGRFLRDTYLDEIPQFYNVLLGQMSVVGPRPSPKSENVLCPLWRDARLSVRPGVTGLWQVNRTREPMLDFQEWIQYDTEYIRRLSWGLDLSICLRTLLQMLGKFTEKFLRIE